MRGKTSNRWILLAILLGGTTWLGGTAWTQVATPDRPSDAVARNPAEQNNAVENNNAAVRLAGEGRQAEAEKLYLAALDGGESDDLARAKIASNLARLYQSQDRYLDAERMFRCALQWRQKKLPATSVEVTYSLNNLAEIYRIEGRNWEARNLMETALRSLQQFHTDAPGLPVVLANLAIMLCRFGELDKAEKLLHTALTYYEEKIHHEKGTETSSREYAIVLDDLGQVLEAKGEPVDAVRLCEQAAGIFERLGVPARADLAATLAEAGQLYQRLDRTEDARQAEERALDLLPPEGGGVLRAQILRNLGNIVAKGGNPADALPYFEESLVIHEKTLGAEHPSTANLLLDYSSASLRAGNKSLAHKLRKRAAELVARLKAQSLPQMTVSVRDLRAAK